jgi:hypothetical protein
MSQLSLHRLASLAIVLASTTGVASAGLSAFDRALVHNYGYLEGYYGTQGGQQVGPFFNLVASNHVDWPGPGEDYDPNVVYGPRPAFDSIGFATSLYEGYIEIDVAALGTRNHYYLELSPWSVYLFQGPLDPMPMSLDIFSSFGDGIVTNSDRGAGSFFTRATINDVYAGWYTPNQYGGFMGDTHVDITSLVSDARAQSQQFLSIRLGVPADAPWLRGLFRAPAVISSDDPIASVPGPSPATIALVYGAACRRRRRS